MLFMFYLKRGQMKSWILIFFVISALVLFLISGINGCVPAAVSCVDSDNGKAYDVQGTVTFGETSLTDFCVGKQLVEYYCNNNMPAIENYTCVYGCSDGACTIPASLTNACVTAGKGYGCSLSCADDEDEVPELSAACGSSRVCCKLKPCFDTDYGINETVRGTVSGIANELEFSYEDKCESNVTLTEYYCENESAVSTSIQCSEGCTFGRCRV
jgi:hypothetical protein